MAGIVPSVGLRKLEPLLGEWEMWALVGEERAGPVRSTVAWLDGGAYAVQRAEIGADPEFPEGWREHSPFPTSMVFGYDDAADEFSALYADGRGVARVYRMAFDGATWRIWRAAEGFHQRFTATLDATGNRLEGSWEASPDGETWSLDFRVTYERVT